MLNKELQLKIAKLLMEESLLTPEKEAEYISAITALTDKNTSLEEENADLKQQLALLKKALYGQKSEKTQVVMEESEQLTMFNEAEEATDVKVF